MSEILLPTFTAFILTALSTPLVIKLAKKYGLVDNPRLRPHPAHTHQDTLPRAGGLPIFLGIVLTALLFIPLTKPLAGIIMGITILLIMGLADDKLTSFSPYQRLGLLFLAAAVAVGSGIGISFMNNPFYGLGLAGTTSMLRLDGVVYNFNLFGPHKIILIADLFALIWIVAITQIVNWSKGVDGQMPSITLVTALTLGILSLRFYSQGDLNQLNIAVLAFITAGASLGFLIFNWYPAKIIPGFSGSTILAFMLAVVSILSVAKVATALLVLAIPTADFVYLFFRRIASGRSPVLPGREHLHHKLLDLGWSHRQISLFYLGGSVILGAVALAVGTLSKLLAAAAVGAAFLAFTLWLNFFGGLSKPAGRGNG